MRFRKLTVRLTEESNALRPPSRLRKKSFSLGTASPAAKAGIDSTALAASLKRCPDTNQSFPQPARSPQSDFILSPYFSQSGAKPLCGGSMKISIYRPMLLLAAVAAIAVSASAQSKPNQTLGYGAGKRLTFTYTQNFDCI